MRLYLSSYRLGNDTESLKKLVGKPRAKVAVTINAVDFSTDHERVANGLQDEMNDMRSLGFEPEHIDLRDYFNDTDRLLEKLSQFDAVWIKGGNVFILRKAMHLSGFDQVIEKLIKTNKLVYTGYSAAVCILGPTLDGAELVDDVNAVAKGYNYETIWDAYGLIDWYPIVHYQSDHEESELVEKELEYVRSKGTKYKTLRDGEALSLMAMKSGL